MKTFRLFMFIGLVTLTIVLVNKFDDPTPAYSVGGVAAIVFLSILIDFFNNNQNELKNGKQE